jgi:hypothetical protein
VHLAAPCPLMFSVVSDYIPVSRFNCLAVHGTYLNLATVASSRTIMTGQHYIIDLGIKSIS